MNQEKVIRLNPDLFMALGLSAEAFGGIGQGWWTKTDPVNRDAPFCVVGHEEFLGMELPRSTVYSWTARNDGALHRAGYGDATRVPFKRWCKVVGVDIQE